MLTNIKSILRSIRQNIFSTTINIVGLSIGLSITFLGLTFIQHKLSFENCFSNVDRIYRITGYNGNTHWAAIPPVYGLMAKTDIPDIVEIARLSLCKEQIVDNGEYSFVETNGCNADNSIFNVFSFNWVAGDQESSLTQPGSVVFTKSIALKYFGQINIIGKTIKIDGNNHTITGIVKDLPANTHIKFNYFVSMQESFDDINSYGRWYNFFTYCLLNKTAQISDIEKKLEVLTQNYVQLSGGSREENKSFHLQPIKTIHLFSNLEKEIPGNSSFSYIIIFFIVVVLILFISCVNFINLSVINTFTRIKEYGVKKSLGASKINLTIHFFRESFIYVMMCAILTIATLTFLWHSNFIKHLHFQLNYINATVFLFLILLITLLVTSYPAHVISKYNIITALKNKKHIKTKFQKISVVFQFAASIFLIACTIAVYSQMSFIQNKSLGFDETATISVKIYGDLFTQIQHNENSMRNELMRNPNVIDMSLTSYELGKRIGYADVIPVSAMYKENIRGVRVINTDGRLLSLLNMKIIKGSDFNENSNLPAVILNEAAVEAYGFKNPLNEQLTVGDTKCNIVGVVKNFNYASLHKNIEPLAITNLSFWLVNMYIKINSSEINEALTYIESVINKISPESSFNYTFLDDTIENQYRDEQNIKKIFNVFTFIALLIACMGLITLTNYTTVLRTKEIGVHKVNGANTGDILLLLNVDIIKWLCIAFIISCPLALLVINKWMRNFAYKTELSWWIFAFAGILSLLIALITMSWHSVRAARRNPVEALRYE